MAIDNNIFQDKISILYGVVCAGSTAGSVVEDCPKDWEVGDELLMLRNIHMSYSFTNDVVNLTLSENAKVYGIVINKDNDGYNSYQIQDTISNQNNQSENLFSVTLKNINISTKAQRNLTRLVAYKDYVFFTYRKKPDGTKSFFAFGLGNGGSIQAVVNDSGNTSNEYGSTITITAKSKFWFADLSDASAELLLEKLVDENGEYVVTP